MHESKDITWHISKVTGVSAPYEAPEKPASRLDTGVLTVEKSIAHILENVLPRLRTGHERPQ